MIPSLALSLLLAAAPENPVLARGFTTPEPGMLETMRRRHRPGQVLRVTSGTARFELRANDLDARGLEGLRAHGRAALPPSDPLPWSNIERIDILTNRTTYGRVMGAILGGLGGMLLPAYPNGYRTDRPHEVRNFFFGGALLGGFAGDYLGRRNIRERALYVAPAMPATRVAAHVAPAAPVVTDPVAVADSVASGSAIAPDVAVADTARPPSIAATPNASFDAVPAGPEVQRAIRRIDSGRLLRIDSAYGRFHGYASQANDAGLSGLRAEPSLESVSGLRALGWQEIARIDVRGGSAGQGALRGALIVGGAMGMLGALVGAAVDSMMGGSEYGQGGAMVAGAGIGLGIGGAVGGLIGLAAGAGVPSWHTVYVKP